MKKRTGIILIAAMCLMTGCSSAVKDGTELLESGAYQEAAEKFQEAAENEKNSAEAYRGLGMAYYELKEYDNALQAFEQALEEGAEETLTLWNLMGICSMQKGDYTKALEYFQNGIGLAQNSGTTSEEAEGFSHVLQEMLFNEIVCYEQLSDWENAKSRMESYIQTYPDDESAAREAEFLKTR